MYPGYVGIRVRDLERSLKFYLIFGWRRLRRATTSNSDTY